MTTMKQLREATFDVAQPQLNPKPLKTASQEFKKRAKSGAGQPLKMYDAGHSPDKPAVVESRARGIITSKLKTMEFLRKGAPKQAASKPQEPAKEPKEQFTPPEKK